MAIEDTLRMGEHSASVEKAVAENAQEQDAHLAFMRQYAQRLCNSLNLVYKKELGNGAMDIVVLAEQRDRTSVAVKISLQNLQNETENMNVVERQGCFVPRVHRVGEYFPAGLSYLVMDYIPVQEYMLGKVDLDTILCIGVDVAKTLTIAHRLRISHNDVKPRNILSTQKGNYLIDWGSSVRRDSKRTADRDMLLCTLNYTAPERLLEPDAEEYFGFADQFSLGASLYVYVTGEMPYNRGDLQDNQDIKTIQLYLDRVSRQDRPSIAFQKSPNVMQIKRLEALDTAITRMMQSNPFNRYSSCGEVAIVLGEISN